MTYVGQQLDLIREFTDNISFSVDSTTGDVVEGISDNLILTFMNDCLQYVQSRIIAQYPEQFVEEDIQNAVAEQEAYSINDNVFLNNKIVSVEFSTSGNLEDYYPLVQMGFPQRNTRAGDPYGYLRRNLTLLLNYIPRSATGKLRVNYYRAIDKLNKRRGQITSKNSTTMVIDNDSDYDSFACSEAQYICTVTKFGVVQDYNIPITSFDTSTRTFTYASQTVNAAAADYIVTGKYSSTHLNADMPDRIWDLIRLYAQLRILNKDSSTDYVTEKPEFKEILADVLDAYTELNEDVQSVPIIDSTTEA